LTNTIKEGLKMFSVLLATVILTGVIIKIVYNLCVLMGFELFLAGLVAGVGTIGSLMVTVGVMLNRKGLI
jgi:hypothetical protein